MSSDKEYFECVGCQEEYDDDDRKPLLLPCGHVCCRGCASAMEDKDDTLCRHVKCDQGWENASLSDLKTVIDLIPGKSRPQGERQVVPASSDRGAGAVAAPRARGTGREVEPVEVKHEDVDGASVAQSCEGRKLLSVTQCPLCMEEYNGNESCPVLLACGHTYCLPCLETLEEKDGHVKCSRCMQMWPKGALKNLPVVKRLVRSNYWNMKNPEKKVFWPNIRKRTEELGNDWRKNEEASKNAMSEIYIKTGGCAVPTWVDLARDTLEDAVRNARGHTNPSCSHYSYGGTALQMNSRLAAFRVRPHSTIMETPRLSGGSLG